MVIRVGIVNNSAVDVWRFEVNKDCYIDLFVNQMYMDTMYDVGKIQDVKHLEETVRHLLKCWKSNHKELFIGEC